MLQYDTTAFTYFVVSVLTCCLLPSYFHILKTFYTHFTNRVNGDSNIFANPVIQENKKEGKNVNSLVRTSVEKDKAMIIMKRCEYKKETRQETNCIRDCIQNKRCVFSLIVVSLSH